MNTTDYAALVALDWGDKTHAFACQKTGADGIEQGMIEATPEALHAWLEKLREACAGRPVALAVEAGRNALLHALLEHAWLTVYPVHPATSARFRRAFTPSGAKDDGPDALVILTLPAPASRAAYRLGAGYARDARAGGLGRRAAWRGGRAHAAGQSAHRSAQKLLSPGAHTGRRRSGRAAGPGLFAALPRTRRCAKGRRGPFAGVLRQTQRAFGRTHLRADGLAGARTALER